MRNVVVWGVHRSGTSVLTQGLERLGWVLGDVDRVCTVENPEGYFENAALRELNGRLLRAAGIAWANWAADPSAIDFDGPAFAGLRAEAANLLDDLDAAAGGGAWAMKDPRMAVLARFWHPILQARAPAPAHLLVLRDPSAVAASQVARALQDPLTYRLLQRSEAMLVLWMRDMLSMLGELARSGVFVARHEALATDAVSVFLDILAFANEQRADPAMVAGLFKPHLHRSRAAHAPAGGPWEPLCFALYERLRAPPVLGAAEIKTILAETAEAARALAYLRPAAPLLAASGSNRAEWF